MYSESYLNDAKLVVKALLSNQLARFAPKLYMRATGETGRGKDAASAAATAGYFAQCFTEYFEHLGFDAVSFDAYLEGKQVLEYGPGDILGVAFLFYAHGAAQVECVDRFALQTDSAHAVDVYRCLLAGLTGAARARGRRAFNVEGDPASGLRAAAVAYVVGKDGLSGRRRHYDLIVSRAVLEHVNDIEATMLDIASALRNDGVSIHQVDLKSHGLDRYQPFEFLTWPDALYRMMFSAKGFPNRWRVDKYREAAGNAGLVLQRLLPTGRLQAAEVALIAPAVAPRFRSVPRDELGWIGFWMTLGLPAAVHFPEHP